MKSVLIVTSRTGGGHVSVARALETALLALHGRGLTVTIADPFDGPRPSPVGHLLRAYAPIIVHRPRLWGLIYNLMSHRSVLKAGMALAAPLAGNGAWRLLVENRPDVVVSVHPLCHHAMVPVLRRWPRRLPLVAVPTDLVCVHTAWVMSPVDLYLAPTDEAAAALLRAGVEPGRIRCVGLPVEPSFGPVAFDQRALRLRLGLAPERLTLLVAGGAEGAGGVEQAALAIGRSDLSIQMVVVCGHNRPLRRRLAAALPPGALVWGFVTNMADLMRAADVVITKAGSVSVAEALAVGRPVLITSAIPGQEEGNLPYVESRGAGKVTSSPSQLLAELRQLGDDPARLATMAARARATGQPDAAYAAARQIGRWLAPSVGLPAALRVGGGTDD